MPKGPAEGATERCRVRTAWAGSGWRGQGEQRDVGLVDHNGSGVAVHKGHELGLWGQVQLRERVAVGQLLPVDVGQHLAGRGLYQGVHVVGVRGAGHGMPGEAHDADPCRWVCARDRHDGHVVGGADLDLHHGNRRRQDRACGQDLLVLPPDVTHLYRAVLLAIVHVPSLKLHAGDAWDVGLPLCVDSAQSGRGLECLRRGLSPTCDLGIDLVLRTLHDLYHHLVDEAERLGQGIDVVGGVHFLPAAGSSHGVAGMLGRCSEGSQRSIGSRGPAIER
mmetsp:Transcript_42545/g.76387  ORF Transcript_42545/g.76387 Transcript_42545/m.76387 type:complete len:277 (-) Transcript_42545:20-850(-)